MRLNAHCLAITIFAAVLLICQPCMGDTFPTGHPDGAVTGEFARVFGSLREEFNVYMWRENYAVWLEIERTGDENPFICSSTFVLIQNNVQFDTVRLVTASGDSQCGDVFINSVFQLSQYTHSGDPADLNYDFSLLFDGNDEVHTIDMIYASKPPTAHAGTHQSVDKGSVVTLDASGCYDEDGDDLTYLWEQTDGDDVTLDNETSMTPTFNAPDVYYDETITFQLTVEDGTFRSTDTVDIVVNDVQEDNSSNDGGGGSSGGCFISGLN